MGNEKNYIDLLIEEARLAAQVENLKRKKKAADDEGELLRMLADLRSRNASQIADSFDELC